MKWHSPVLRGAVTILVVACSAAVAAAHPGGTGSFAPASLRRCEDNYSQEEIDALIASGEDGYEPDDCAPLAPTLTGPMLHNFCQPGDEDWVKFIAKPNVIYQIKAESPANYPTQPHLDLLDGGSVIAQNDHYSGSAAEIWWWNAEAERTMYVRVTEMHARADCGNDEYTLSVKAFKDKP